MLRLLRNQRPTSLLKRNGAVPSPLRSSSELMSFRQFSAETQKEQTSSAPANKSLVEKLWGLESNVADKSFKSRWMITIPAVVTHICIGSPWAWSMVADVITREYGFVTSAAADWTMMQSSMALSLVFGAFGISASLLGKWQLKVGARKSIAYGAAAFGGAMALGSLGIYLHSLPLTLGGYGILGGLGIGFAYNPPIQALLQWFPDKKGFASGVAIAGFGSGALLFTPAVQYFTKKFAKMPEYLGPVSEFSTKTIEGKLFADVNGALVEVVQAGAAELAKIPYTLQEGLYVVGSGSTGAMETLGALGVVYTLAMLGSSLTMKVPHPSYSVALPAAATPSGAPATPPVAIQPVPDMSVEDATRTKQFALLWMTFYCLATGGMGMFSVAKPMMSEVFSAALPAIVTSAFASKYVLMLSSGNLGGRLGWAAISDKIGRRNAFTIFTLASIPVYLSLPTLVENVVTSGSSVPLYLFCGGTMIAVAGMGGAYALLPAYEADLFGTKNIAAIHGRMLLASSSAAISGPYLLLKLRSIAEQDAITDLLSRVSPERFEAVFGAPMEKAAELFAAKTLTISKLLALCPPGTIDPTPHLYDTTMYTLSVLMMIGTLSHNLVRPLNRAVTTTPQQNVDVEVKKVIDVVAKDEVVGDRQVNKQ